MRRAPPRLTVGLLGSVVLGLATSLSCAPKDAPGSAWRDGLVPASPCYDVDLLDGLDDRDTTELQATFACLNSQEHLAPLAPSAEVLDRPTAEGPPVGVALVKGVTAALQRADLSITGLLDTVATSLDDPDEPIELGVDLLLELAHGQPASSLRAADADLRNPEALARAPLTRLAPVLLQTADTLGRRPALRRRIGDLLGNPELVRWVHTVEAFLNTDHPDLPPLTDPLFRDIGDALLAVAPNAEDPRPNRLRRAAEILLAGDQPLLGQLARPVHGILSDEEVRQGFEDAIVRWHDRGHLSAVAAELAWLASVTPQGRPRSRGADSGLTAMVRMLHAGNRPIRCTVDLGLTDLSIDLGNLSLVLLDILADQPADAVFSATGLLGGALGSPITDTLLDLFASTGVCPALTPQFLSDLEVVSLLDEDQADDLVVVFLDLLRLLRDGREDRLPEIADIASTLVDTNTLVPLEDLVRDLGPQPLVAHVVGLAPMLARPARWGIRHPRSLPGELLDVIDGLDTLVAPRSDGPGLGFEPWVPLVEDVLLQDHTWEALDALARVWADPRTTWSSLPPRLPTLLALDPTVDTLAVGSTLVGDDAVASPLLSAVREGSLVAQLSASRPVGDDPRVPVAFLSELATDGTLDDTLDLVRILLDLLEDGAPPLTRNGAPMPETAYRDCHAWGARLTHGYGPRVHILADPWSLSLLARLAHPDTHTREVHALVESGYRRLLEAAVEQLPLEQAVVPTRTGAHYEGVRLVPDTRVVVVDVARAGMLPAIVFQRGLLDVMSAGDVRVDHLYMQRVSDAEGRVTGVDHTGSKIGGDVEGAVLFIPDPMAATGGSMVDAIRTYERAVDGTPARIVVCHLMATPEYVTRITETFPEVEIYCLRIDRGLSPAEVLAGPMGADTQRERGLNGRSYIVPGAGGLGELINNTEH